MSSRAIVLILFVLACSPDNPAPSEGGGSSGAESETVSEQACEYCEEQFLDVLAVHCGEAVSSLTVCEACCHSDALEEACQNPCEMGDCAAACAPVEATPNRHQDCLEACMIDSCQSACGWASVDVVCEQACTDFLACAAPGVSCEETEACMASACLAGA